MDACCSISKFKKIFMYVEILSIVEVHLKTCNRGTVGRCWCGSVSVSDDGSGYNLAAVLFGRL